MVRERKRTNKCMLSNLPKVHAYVCLENSDVTSLFVLCDDD